MRRIWHCYRTRASSLTDCHRSLAPVVYPVSTPNTQDPRQATQVSCDLNKGNGILPWSAPPGPTVAWGLPPGAGTCWKTPTARHGESSKIVNRLRPINGQSIKVCTHDDEPPRTCSRCFRRSGDCRRPFPFVDDRVIRALLLQQVLPEPAYRPWGKR